MSKACSELGRFPLGKELDPSLLNAIKYRKKGLPYYNNLLGFPERKNKKSWNEESVLDEIIKNHGYIIYKEISNISKDRSIYKYIRKHGGIDYFKKLLEEKYFELLKNQNHSDTQIKEIIKNEKLTILGKNQSYLFWSTRTKKWIVKIYVKNKKPIQLGCYEQDNKDLAIKILSMAKYLKLEENVIDKSVFLSMKNEIIKAHKL